MIKGFASFQEHFRGFEDCYIIIGGTACDLLMEEVGRDFRATKDIDLVLLIEALTPAFGQRFWEYIKAAGYEHKNKSTGANQFYRFSHPTSPSYPLMIELFSRKPDAIVLPEDKDIVLTPIPIDEEISSLSAILLDDNYYKFLQEGKDMINSVPVLDAIHIIPFKMKAWLDLSERKKNGENIDSKNIKKHRNDVFRLTEMLSGTNTIVIPEAVHKDMGIFFKRIQNEEIDLKQLGVRMTFQQALERIKENYKL